VLEIRRTDAGVVACLAQPAALDAFDGVAEAYGCRVAPDELWLVAPPAKIAEVERAAAAYCARADAGALVLDQSDGWSTFTLAGDGARRVFAQLSAVPLPASSPAFVQGMFAGGPAKVLVVDGAIHVLVPSTLRHHVTGRLGDVVGRAAVPAAATPFLGEHGSAPPRERTSAAAAR
jgi:sarcosine oxidase gamma subunit